MLVLWKGRCISYPMTYNTVPSHNQLRSSVQSRKTEKRQTHLNLVDKAQVKREHGHSYYGPYP